MKYSIILTLWLMVFFIPKLFDYSAIDSIEEVLMTLHFHGFLSFILLYLLFMVERSKLTVLLGLNEFIIIILNLLAALGIGYYYTGFTFFYDQYGMILSCLNTIGMLILLSWFPRDRLFSGISTAWNSFAAKYLHSHSRFQAY